VTSVTTAPFDVQILDNGAGDTDPVVGAITFIGTDWASGKLSARRTQ
jgi:hypothetical protein